MPKKNQKALTIPERVFNEAKKKADKLGKSVAGFVTDLIEEAHEVPAS